MDYMLLIYADEATMNQAATAEVPGMDEPCQGLVSQLCAKGTYIAADRLQPVATATSVRVRDGQRLVTDGPFAETREQLAGYLIFSADSLEEAHDVAAQHPVAEYGTVEVRPVMNFPFPKAETGS
ncbi:YciI family protein [bacterium]|nr:MAG: YciI family protein [bacterium]